MSLLRLAGGVVCYLDVIVSVFSVQHIQVVTYCMFVVSGPSADVPSRYFSKPLRVCATYPLMLQGDHGACL